MPVSHSGTATSASPPYQPYQQPSSFSGLTSESTLRTSSGNSAGRSGASRQSSRTDSISSESTVQYTDQWVHSQSLPSPSERTPLFSQAPPTYDATPAPFPSYPSNANLHHTLPLQKRQDSLVIPLWIVMFLFALFIGGMIGSFTFGDAFVENHVRKQWEIEHKQHEEWKMHTIAQRAKWNIELEEHEKWTMRTIAERANWKIELAVHDELKRVMVIERRVFAVEFKEMNVARALWAAEKEHWEVERQEEMKERQREREREQQREEEERKRAGMTWSPIQHDHRCSRYGTRKYWARLENMPEGFNKARECKMLKANINGRMIEPSYCDDKGGNGVWGNWYIDFGESDCSPMWSNIQEKDCTARGSGLRRVEATLENLHPDDDAQVMCKSTPFDFRGEHFEGPMSCAKSWGRSQMIGYWYIRDDECR